MMMSRLSGLARRAFMAVVYSTLGAAAVSLIVFVVYMNGRPDLNVWHLVDLDEEITADSKIDSFDGYVELEERVFKQLDELVYAEISPAQRTQINRYHRGSLSDPQRWEPNWNRTFELRKPDPRAGVLLLHGMSDSPYSLRQLGQRLHASGAHVLGLRMPGHGTAPSGLVELAWQDMAAATRLAMWHLAEQNPGRPLYIVGYSTGAALAVHYALAALENEALPRIERIVLLSPAIGVSSVAAFAVWQARLGHLLGLDKLAWNLILPEYDPFKYGSFAVNAGDVVYQLTNEIQARITALDQAGKLAGMPRILAFSSVVDATVSTPALVSGLFERLPANGHELVLFDINRVADMEPLLKWNSDEVIRALQQGSDQTFTLSVVTNETEHSQKVVMASKHPGGKFLSVSRLGQPWPDDVYSLAHVALPFPPNDPLYGGQSAEKSPGIRLGNIALRGERDALKVSASDMLRLRWNPFYAFVEARLLEFVGLDEPQESGRKL
jgi:alpha-beta hydrolase superfamily lysophospholipase